MKIIKPILFFSILLLMLAACKRDNANSNASDKSATSQTASAATNINHSEVASELCGCMQPIIDLNKKIQRLAKAGKTDEVSSMISEVEKLTAEGEVCTGKLESKYGNIYNTDQAKIEAAMSTVCPEVASMIARAGRKEG